MRDRLAFNFELRLEFGAYEKSGQHNDLSVNPVSKSLIYRLKFQIGIRIICMGIVAPENMIWKGSFSKLKR